MKQGTTIAVITLLTLAGTALAQPGSPTFVSGFMHTTLGGATFDPPVERRLPVRNLGSSGEDGVEVHLNSALGSAVDVDMTPVVHAATSSEIKVRFKGWDGTIKGSCRFSGYGGGAGRSLLECDFSPLGVQAIQVQCRDALGNVVAEFMETGSVVNMEDQGVYGIGEQPVWRMGARKFSLQDFSFSVRCDKASPKLWLRAGSPPLVIPNVMEITFRPICIVSPCPGDWTNLSSLLVTATGDSSTVLVCSNAALDWSWGVSNSGSQCTQCGQGRVYLHATGQGQMLEENGDIDGDGVSDLLARVTNIGTSGQDGVTVHVPEGTPSMRNRWRNGHVTLLKLYDDDTGAESRVIVANNPPAGAMSFTPDFLGMGTTEAIVKAYDENGAVLAVRPITAGMSVSVVGIICPPGTYPIWVYYKGGYRFVGCGHYYDIVLPGGPPVTGVHAVSIEPTGATTQFHRIHRLSITSDDMTDIVLGDLRLIDAPPGGPTCDSIDFNNDGLFPDAYDIDDFLSVFSGGACSNDPVCGDIDFNNDDLYPDSSDIDSLLSVFGGGPCL